MEKTYGLNAFERALVRNVEVRPGVTVDGDLSYGVAMVAGRALNYTRRVTVSRGSVERDHVELAGADGLNLRPTALLAVLGAIRLRENERVRMAESIQTLSSSHGKN